MIWQAVTSRLLDDLIRRPRLGLVTDVDGTISPIVANPQAAVVTPRSRQLLHELQACLPLVAVISGRQAEDVYHRVGVPGVVYVGNHGLERWENGRLQLMPEVSHYRPALAAALAAIESQKVQGMRVEDKGATLSVHYRQTDKPDIVAARYEPIIREIVAAHGLRFFQGRMVFEVRPPIDVNKGSALYQLVKEYQLDGVLYLGDDTTDVDAFIVAQQLRQEAACYALGVGVLSSGTPTAVRDNADLFAAGVADVESLLAWLLSARKASFT